jgi:NAD(P)-dependent dehydrogenase (short-subunit alcohol dehydrogenase family)
MATLVIGGTSGLGLEIAKRLIKDGDVYITGRRDPKQHGLHFDALDLSAPELSARVAALINRLPEVTTLVYAAGYYQEGRVTDLDEAQIEDMLSVGTRGLVYTVRAVLAKQGKLDTLITITSTSQWTPRQKEPIYNLVKAGAAHFSHAMAEDGRVSKVLVTGPGGMNTPFWRNAARGDAHTLLDPIWVADQVMELQAGDYGYRFAKIMRNPARVEIIETN